MKFSRLANNPQLLNEYLIKSDYDIIYKKVLIKSLQTEMNFKCFIETLESIAEKVSRVYNLVTQKQGKQLHITESSILGNKGSTIIIIITTYTRETLNS